MSHLFQRRATKLGNEMIKWTPDICPFFSLFIRDLDPPQVEMDDDSIPNFTCILISPDF